MRFNSTILFLLIAYLRRGLAFAGSVMDERRRATRVALGGHAAQAQVLINLDVQVVDISTAGVLLQTSQRLEPGMRGCLRLNLWGRPFSAEVEVRRVKQLGDGARKAGYDVGAAFVGIMQDQLQLIEQFANQ